MSAPWSFRVEQAFRVTGQGIAVLGDLSGVIPQRVQPGELHTDGRVLPVARVAVEFALLRGGAGERIALVLRGVDLDQVPAGATIHPRGAAIGGTIGAMTYAVDFTTVSTVGLESSPVAEALAGLRANEARYFKNKYEHVFTTEPADQAKDTIDWVHGILADERGMTISSPPLEASAFQVENIRWAYVFYQNGLSINVLYTLDDGGKRAVGFKLSDGMEIPEDLAGFKFARQKSKLAGTIRGSYFVIKKEH